MLGAGIRELRERNVIDDRLYDWSESLAALRNLAAHPEDITVSRQDVEDMQAFVNAITEYVYDHLAADKAMICAMFLLYQRFESRWRSLGKRTNRAESIH
jgi:Domain of unknown function (DUF4145)